MTKIRILFSVAVYLLTTTVTTGAHALTLSSNELAAAERLGCVLADDALGYLNEDQFNARFDEVVEDFSDEQVDVIYAKALGYIDGLLFGVDSAEVATANRRLEAYSNSNRCESVTARTAGYTLSL